MSHKDYIAESFIRALKDNITGFKELSHKFQHSFAVLIYESDLKKRQHNRLDGFISISYQELHSKFGKKQQFNIANDELKLFEVTKNWYSSEKQTKGYKLTPKVSTIKHNYFEKQHRKLDKLVSDSGKYQNTLPKAVAAKDSEGFTATAWKNTSFKTTVPIDLGELKKLKKHYKNLLKIGELDCRYSNLFSEHETPEKYLQYLDQLNQVIRSAHTQLAGKGYIIHRYIESKAGRLYAKNLNLQTTKRVIKQAALHGMWEYDFENCHYSIFNQLCDSYGFICSGVIYYLDNKTEVRNTLSYDLGLTLDQVKAALLAALYGASITPTKGHALHDIAGDKTTDLIKHELFKSITEDIKKGQKLIIDNWPHTSRARLKNNAGKWISKKEPIRKILAHLIQGIEAQMLNIAIRDYQDSILLVQHDGFATNKQLDKQDIERKIREETGFNIQVSEDKIQLEIGL